MRAQSAGGNASGNPPYPALTWRKPWPLLTQLSRTERRAEYQLAAPNSSRNQPGRADLAVPLSCFKSAARRSAGDLFIPCPRNWVFPGIDAPSSSSERVLRAAKGGGDRSDKPGRRCPSRQPSHYKHEPRFLTRQRERARGSAGSRRGPLDHQETHDPRARHFLKCHVASETFQLC